MRKVIWIIIILFILLVGGSLALPKTITLPSLPQTKTQSSPAALQQLVKVTKVIDGDTIEIESGQKVRYIGVDTPEVSINNRKGDCYGEEAKTKNKELVEGKMVRLEKDVSEVDKFGRLLRYVYVYRPNSLPAGRQGKEIFINEYLVMEGYAFSATFPPDVKYAKIFLEKQQEARSLNKGLWESCKKSR